MATIFIKKFVPFYQRGVVEKGNAHDPYAVAVTKGELIVGHLPRKISAACSLFLHRNGLITARVTDSRQYSIDLPQGGLEVPCVLKFVGEVIYVEKVKKLLPHPSTSTAQMHGEIEQASKKRKVSVVEIDDASGSHKDFWVRFDSLILTAEDRKIVAEGKELSDKHMNFAQSLMKQQFTSQILLLRALFQLLFFQTNEVLILQQEVQSYRSSIHVAIIGLLLPLMASQIKFSSMIHCTLV